jgi:hypothetical protein
MTTQVIEVTNITNLIEIVNLPVQLISEVISNIVSETTNQINLVEVDSTSLVLTSSTTSRELVEIPTTTNVIEQIASAQVISETIPVLYGEEEVAYSKRIDFINDNLLYRGEASPGTATNASAWRIRKITIGVDGDVTEEWADGNSQFTKIWDNHLSLTYS